MKKRRLLQLIAAITCLVMALGLFAACKPKEEPKPDPDDNKPTETITVGDLFADFVNDLTAAYNVDGTQAVKLNVKADLTATDKDKNKSTYSIEAKGNVNVVDTTADKSKFYLKTLDTTDSEDIKNLLNVYYQDSRLYIESGNDIWAVRGFDMLSLFGKSSTAATAETDGTVKMIGDLLFSKGDVVKDESNAKKYTVNINLASVWNNLMNGEYGALIQPLINSLHLIYDGMELNCDNIAALLSDLGLTVTINADFSESATLNVRINTAKKGSLSADFSSMVVENGSYDANDIVSGLNDTKIEAAQANEINLANVEVNGTFALTDASGRAYMNYDWKLMSNIDPFAFVKAANKYKNDPKLNPYDWINDESIKGSKFHFQVSHKCDDSCNKVWSDGSNSYKSFCVSRMNANPTNILDIAFDPATMGDANIYINLNSKAILSSEGIVAILNSIPGVGGLAGIASGFVEGLLTQNSLIPISIPTLSKPYETAYVKDNTAATADLDISAITELLPMLKPLLAFIDNGIELKDNENAILDVQLYSSELMKFLDDAFDLGSTLAASGMDLNVILNAVFGGEFAFDSFGGFNLTIGSVDFGNKELDNYNCYEKVVLNDPVTGELRPYDVDDDGEINHMPVDLLNKDSIRATGNIKSSTKMAGTIYEEGMYFSPEEMKFMIGSLVEYEYEGLDGKTYTAKSQIVGFKNVDYDNYSTVQNITLITLPLDGNGTFGGLCNLLPTLGQMAGLELKLPLPCSEISFPIKFTEYKSAEIVSKDIPDEIYYPQSGWTKISNSAKGDLTITYNAKDAAGKDIYPTKKVEINCSETNLYVEGKDYGMTECGDYYIKFNFADVNVEYNFKMATPETAVMEKIGTESAPVDVLLGSNAYNDEKVYIGGVLCSGFAAFNSASVILTYTDGHVNRVVPDKWSYTFEDKTAIQDGKFVKKGVFKYTVTFRKAFTITGYVNVTEDDTNIAPIVTASYTKNGITVKTPTAIDKDITLKFGIRIVSSSAEEVSPRLYSNLKIGDTAASEYTYTLAAGTTSVTIPSSAITADLDITLISGDYKPYLTVLDENGKWLGYEQSSAYGAVIKKVEKGNLEVVFNTSDKIALIKGETKLDGLIDMYVVTGEGENRQLVMTTLKWMDDKGYCLASEDGSVVIPVAATVTDYSSKEKVAMTANGAIDEYVNSIYIALEGDYNGQKISINSAAKFKSFSMIHTGQLSASSLYSHKWNVNPAKYFKMVYVNADLSVETLQMKWSAEKGFHFVANDGTEFVAEMKVTDGDGNAITLDATGCLSEDMVGKKAVFNVTVKINDDLTATKEATCSNVKA